VGEKDDKNTTQHLTAHQINSSVAQQVAMAVKSTLGPKGMDKMIIDPLGDTVVTNDGVTILTEMRIQHPTAKMIVDIAKTQEEEVGDGTTTAVVFAGELMSKADFLLSKNIHPTIIIKGFKNAADHTINFLNSISESIDDEKLIDIVKTAMTGKSAELVKEYLAPIIVEAIRTAKDRDAVLLESVVGLRVKDSKLVKGVILKKKKVHYDMPNKIVNPKIALVSSKIGVLDMGGNTSVQVTDPNSMEKFFAQNENIVKKMVNKIKEAKVNVVFCSKEVDDIAGYLLNKEAVLTFKNVNMEKIEALAKATGAKIISNVNDIKEEMLGKAGSVEVDESYVSVNDCENPKAVTIFLQGGTEHVVDEMRRAVEDAIGVLSILIDDKKIVGGAGAVEMEVVKEINKYADEFSGKEQLVIKAFADAIEVIPTALIDNAGLDSIDVVSKLKYAHNEGKKWAGVNVFKGEVIDSVKEGIIEPVKVKIQAIETATDVVNMILRIDDMVAGEERSPQNNYGA